MDKPTNLRPKRYTACISVWLDEDIKKKYDLLTKVYRIRVAEYLRPAVHQVIESLLAEESGRHDNELPPTESY